MGVDFLVEDFMKGEINQTVKATSSTCYLLLVNSKLMSTNHGD